MNKHEGSRLCILCGAGASHGCGARAPNPGSDDRPPLAKDIFAEKFEHILARWEALQHRTDEIRTRLKNGGNMEAILRDLYESAEKNAKLWTFQIPLYLRDLFFTISTDYKTGSTKYDTLVRRVLESSLDEVMFISLNYDLFLDHALEGYESRDFISLDSYVPNDKKWCLVKLHGSINWAREIDNHLSYRMEFDAKPHFPQASEMKIVMRGSNGYYVPNQPLNGYPYPQIVIPADKPKDFACPSLHTERAKAFIKDCDSFVLIGFSGHDEDIASLLETMPSGSRLAIVGGGNTDAEATLQNICSRADGLTPEKLVKSFHNQGFANFVDGEELQKILPD